jgi:hypothetical protein
MRRVAGNKLRPNEVERHLLPHPKIKDVIDGCLHFNASERLTFVQIENTMSDILQEMKMNSSAGTGVGIGVGGSDAANTLPRHRKRTSNDNVNMTLKLTRSIGHKPGNRTLLRVLNKGGEEKLSGSPSRRQPSSASTSTTLRRSVGHKPGERTLLRVRSKKNERVEEHTTVATLPGRNNGDERDGREAAIMTPPPPAPPAPPMPPLHQGITSSQRNVNTALPWKQMGVDGEVEYAAAEGVVPGNETLMRKWKQGENKTLMRNWKKDAAEESSRFGSGGAGGAGGDIPGNRTLMRKWGAGENKTMMRKKDEEQSSSSNSSGGDHTPGNQTLMRKWGAGAGDQTLIRKK